MSRFAPRIRLPKYRHHKAKDLALVTFDGRDYYLGKYGSPESRAAYDQLIGHWVAHGRCLPPDAQALALPIPAVQPGASALTTMRTAPSPAYGGEALSVGEFVLAYLKYAKARYARHGRFYSIRAAFRILLKLFRDLPLVDFGPKRLMEVRQTLVGRDLIRREINRRVQWIRKGIAWAVQEELCPGEVLYRLSPHTIRHTTATHLLRAGVDINTIRCWLGHASLDTTNIYAEIDLKMKADALAKCRITPGRAGKRWQDDADLMAFLRSL